MTETRRPLGRIGLVQGEIVLSNTDGGPALYSIPVFLKVVRAPLKRDEARPEPTPRMTLSRHIRDKVDPTTPQTQNTPTAALRPRDADLPTSGCH